MDEQVKISPMFLAGIITGIVLCILQGTGNINIGWFWATFPFWIVPAIDVAIVLIVFVVALMTGVSHRNR